MRAMKKLDVCWDALNISILHVLKNAEGAIGWGQEGMTGWGAHFLSARRRVADTEVGPIGATQTLADLVAGDSADQLLGMSQHIASDTRHHNPNCDSFEERTQS